VVSLRQQGTLRDEKRQPEESRLMIIEISNEDLEKLVMDYVRQNAPILVEGKEMSVVDLPYGGRVKIKIEEKQKEAA
jgi:hypothetical protein